MAFVIKVAKTLRNNWKKSTFFAVVFAWGASYTRDHFRIQNLLAAYCEKAAVYGKQPIPVSENPRNISIILNPNANKRKALKDFEKYCAPLLYLAGLNVEILRTESEGHAKNLIENVKDTQALVVAGGDGTLSETITGLLRRTNENINGLIPIGIIPLGKTNTMANYLFQSGSSKIDRIKSMAEAAMAIIEEQTRPVDVMRIEILNEENKKPIYAIDKIKWGAYRDAEDRVENYWYFGGFKKYLTYIFNGLKSDLSWDCQAQLNYTAPCSGCSNCYTNQNLQTKSKWFQRFTKQQNDINRQYLHVKNPECNNKLEKTISTTDFILSTLNNGYNSTIPKLTLSIGPKVLDYFEFVKQGWKFEGGKNVNRKIKEQIDARTVEIQPLHNNDSNGKNQWYSIDSENYEVKPIRVTLLPKILNMYCKKE